MRYPDSSTTLPPGGIVVVEIPDNGDEMVITFEESEQGLTLLHEVLRGIDALDGA